MRVYYVHEIVYLQSKLAVIKCEYTAFGINIGSAFYSWQWWDLHSGPERAGSQTTPQYNPLLSTIGSQLWSHTPPDAPECEHSAPPLRTSVAPPQEGPVWYNTQRSEKCILQSNIKEEKYLADSEDYTVLNYHMVWIKSKWTHTPKAQQLLRSPQIIRGKNCQ